MNGSAVVTQASALASERLRRSWDWSAVVASYTHQDWPPPEWLDSPSVEVEGWPFEEDLAA